MASADFSRQILFQPQHSPVNTALFCCVRETSPGKNALFLSIYPPHVLCRRFRTAMGFQFVEQPYPSCRSLMWFLYIGPEICLHLPSDSTSRWTPLVFGYDLPAVGQSRDFHPQEYIHAGRTTKKAHVVITYACVKRLTE